MKKALVIVAVVALLGVSSVASANMFGWGGGYGGHMMGYGYGPMMGYGYGPMMGYGYGPMTDYGYDTEEGKYLDETTNLRREFNSKRFEYSEAVRTGDEKKAEIIAKDLDELTGKIGEKVPSGSYFASGYGTGPYCW